MQVETKYNLGEKLFYLSAVKKIKEHDVVSIHVTVDNDIVRELYTMDKQYVGESLSKDDLFRTKKDLLLSLEDVNEDK